MHWFLVKKGLIPFDYCGNTCLVLLSVMKNAYAMLQICLMTNNV